MNNFLKTPLVNFSLEKKVFLFSKLEAFNPTGSIKYRMVKFMMNRAEKSGLLKPGAVILEATTGNTGIALAYLGKKRGYKTVLILPRDASLERVKILKKLGAKVILVSVKGNLKSLLKKRDELAFRLTNVWIPCQFSSPLNFLAYKKDMVREIVGQLGDRRIDWLVLGVGTGGSLMGLGLGLKKYFPKLKIMAVEPSESAVLSGEKPGKHNISGIGEGFIPDILDTDFIDKVLKIDSFAAFKMTKFLNKKGFFVGISSGANFLASIKLAKKLENKNILTVFPDSGDRYLSLFNK